MASLHRTLGVLYLDSNNVVQFGFKKEMPTTVRGIDLLTQNIIIRLFTTSGSNGYDTDLGASLYRVIGQGYMPGKEQEIQADLALTFEAIEDQILNEQAGEISLRDDETLKSLVLGSIEYDELTQTWEIKAKITTADSTAAVFTIVE